MKGRDMAKAEAKGRSRKTPAGAKGVAVYRRKAAVSDEAKNTTSASALLKAQMPNWEVVKSGPVVMPKGADMRTDESISITKLRGKFLGQHDSSAAAVIGDVDQGVRTLRIKPKSGGSAKTADIRNGKVTIVQG
jgi:hypothetical protein